MNQSDSMNNDPERNEDYPNGNPFNTNNRIDNSDAPRLGFRILNWNINGVIGRIQQLKLLLNTENYDVITLQETKLTDRTHFNLYIPGYRKFVTPSKISNSLPSRGLVTLVKEEFASQKIKHLDYDNAWEYLIINIKTPHGIFEIQNIYWPHTATLANNKLQNISKANPKANNICVCGDFNSHHTDWIALRGNNNVNGQILSKILHKSNLVLANDIEPTTTTGSMIDLCLVNNTIAPVTKVNVTNHLSDIHYALEININITKFLTQDEFIPRIKFENADWDLFKQKLDQNFGTSKLLDNIRPETLDEDAIKMAEIYYKTATQTIPQTKFHQKPWQSWYWCPEVARATRKANYWRKAHKKKLIIPNLVDKKNQAINEETIAVQTAKNNAWSRICNEIILTDNTAKSWKKIKNIRRVNLPPSKVKLIDPREKANELAGAFAQRTSSSNLTQRIQQTMAALEPDRIREINDAIATPDPEYDIDITDFEIDSAFSRGKNSAPGIDKVTYSMTKNSGPIAKSIAKQIYNVSWNTGRLANTWKVAAQVPIPKPGNRDEFRPISLLSVFDKNIERIAHNRLMNKIGHKLHPNLLGFSEGRGTQDGLIAVSNAASEHIFGTARVRNSKNQRGKQHCVAVFVDLEKAFEMANANVILSTLAQLGVKGKLLAWIKNYLSDRGGFVTIEGHHSDTHQFENGTPQGSIISPALFNILIHALLSYPWPKEVEVYSYADDLVILARTKHYTKVINSALETLSIACEDLGLKINAKKTKIMFFDNVKRKKEVRPKFYVGLAEDRAEIEIVDEFKYLGVIYTSTLNANKHIMNTISKTYRKINLLKALSCKEYGCNTKTLVRYVTTCIRPVLEYGILTINAAKVSIQDLDKLESVIPRALKIAMGLPNCTRNHAVLVEAGLTNMWTRAGQSGMNALAKLLRDQKEHPLREKAENTAHSIATYFHRHGAHKVAHKKRIRCHTSGPTPPITDSEARKQPWLQGMLTRLVDNPNIWQLIQSINPIITYKTPVGAPYRHTTELDILPLTNKKSMLTEDEKEAARKIYSDKIHIQANTSYLTIYTDASVNPENNKATFGCAVFENGILNPSLSKIGRISDHSGSMTTELHAIQSAVDIVFQHRLRFDRSDKFLIVTDSMSGIIALKNTNNPDNKHCILGIHQKLELLHETHNISGTIMWCPSHIGIEGNELADKMAGEAMNLSLEITETPAARSVIKCKINTAAKEMWKKQCVISDYYATVNPLRQKFIVPHAPRPLQVKIIKLRHNAYRKCSYQCINFCAYCDDNMSTGHYMLSCPVTSRKLQDYRDLLTQDEHRLSTDYQAAAILNKISKTEHSLLLDILGKSPPSVYCSEHTGIKKYPHIEFMPP